MVSFTVPVIVKLSALMEQVCVCPGLSSVNVKPRATAVVTETGATGMVYPVISGGAVDIVKVPAGGVIGIAPVHIFGQLELGGAGVPSIGLTQLPSGSLQGSLTYDE